MQEVKAIDGRHARSGANRRAAAVWRAGLAALSIAGLGTACMAADSMSGLGSAFRPQGGANAPVAGNGERTDVNQAGLRVVVSSASRSVASIDGQIVHVGDIVNGMRVTQINPQGVVLTGEGGVEERLMVNPSAVKHTRPVKARHVSNGVRQ